jgi:molybdopterin molybdotransferase
MISYPEALTLILAEARPLEAEVVPLNQADGRFLAQPMTAPGPVPPFPNSAMDGFALATGGETLPPGSVWKVAGSLAAGDRPVDQAPSGGSSAFEIMTGAPVPPGLDTVIPVEEVEVIDSDGARPTEIRIPGEVVRGLNIRPAGKDFQEGDPALEAGRRIGPVEVMALAALGIPKVPVFRAPRALVLSTGPELVSDPQTELAPGEIRNSNGPFLSRAVTRQGVQVLKVRTLGDDPAPFLQEVEGVLTQGVDLVISTGAVSMGRHDFVPRALNRLGARLLFHKAAIRPGKPILAAVLPGGAHFFGLPGNPISATVGFRFFVYPLLRKLRGKEEERPWTMPLLGEATSPPALRTFYKARVEVGDEGTPGVRVLEGQQSFRIQPLLQANAWAVFPQGEGRHPPGTLVDVHPLLDGSAWTGSGD